MALGHSWRNGGPGVYGFQPWVYELIRGLDETDEQIMTLITKHDIPKHAGAIDLIELINKLDNAQSQGELDNIVDKFIQIINCSRREPTVTITLSNKNLLIYELVYDEVVRKRRSQVKSITEGLQVSGFLKFIKQYPDLCRPIFVGPPGEALNAEIIFNCIEEDGENYDYEKQEAVKHFKKLISISTTETLERILKFATGFSSIPPWGLRNKISIKFLADDDDKLYPEAMACFSILYLATVHSSEQGFIRHFEKALEIEGIGFSTPA